MDGLSICTLVLNIHNSSTRSYPLEGEKRRPNIAAKIAIVNRPSDVYVQIWKSMTVRIF
jgi:hypothetical protein